MTTKSVLRSVRLALDVDRLIEEQAARRGISVSAFIRAALAEVTERDERRLRLERSLQLAVALPDFNDDRHALWRLENDVPR